MARIIDLKNTRPKRPIPERERDVVFPQTVQAKPRLTSTPDFALPQTQNQIQNPVKKEPPNFGIISWSALPDRQPNFRLIFSVSLGLFAIAALIQVFDGNVITTIFFALLGAVLLLSAKKKNTIGNFEISPLGVKTGGKLFGFREIKSFWIEYDLQLGIKELSLQLKRWYAPYVKVPLADQNPVQIRAYLLEFLPEEEHKDTLTDVLARKLGI